MANTPQCLNALAFLVLDVVGCNGRTLRGPAAAEDASVQLQPSFMRPVTLGSQLRC